MLEGGLFGYPEGTSGAPLDPWSDRAVSVGRGAAEGMLTVVAGSGIVKCLNAR